MASIWGKGGGVSIFRVLPGCSVGRDVRMLIEEEKAALRKVEKSYKKLKDDKNPKLFHKKPPPPAKKK